VKIDVILSTRIPPYYDDGQVALNTVFDFGNGNTLTLENTVLTDLTVDDFGFGENALAVMYDLVDVLI